MAKATSLAGASIIRNIVVRGGKSIIGWGLMVALLGGFAGRAGAVQSSDELIALWGTEPVEHVSATRGSVVLNGLWRFRPAGDDGPTRSRAEWGTIWVPGCWNGFWKLPGLLDRGTGKHWKSFAGDRLARGWYARTVRIPPEWAGRAIHLELVRVSTDAVVYVNDVECGKVEWPGGEVEITKAVTAGKDASVRILVVATTDAGEVLEFMGPEANQRKTTKAKLDARGIIGDVLLTSRPAGAYISDVFVITSVRKREVTLNVELTGVKETGEVRFIATMFDENGKREKRFKTDVDVIAAPGQTVRATFRWRRPRLWGFNRPNMYVLKLNARGAGIEDEYSQRFGFREFWIDGRKFFLNGTEIRLRPTMCGSEVWSSMMGIWEAMDSVIDGFKWAGFNFQQLWPWDHGARGSVHFRELWCDRADRKGWPLAGVALDMLPYIHSPNWEFTWDRSGVKEKWERRMVAELKRYRNHPSILMWGTSANYFGHGEDQNPRYIGVRDRLRSRGGGKARRAGLDGVSIIKRHDPTRPVFTHQGGMVGDLQTVNCYLNMIPLQEREEWLSNWSENGDMPVMAVEFGTPLHATFMRGRNAFSGAIVSEPLMTEFCAIYLGRRAYDLETDEYRKRIVDSFVKDQEYKSWHNDDNLDMAPAHQELQALFSRNTWRAWRTFGLTGGMVPWNEGHGVRRTRVFSEAVSAGLFQPGRPGTYFPTVERGYLNFMREPETEITPGGRAIMEANGPFLAWIAGPPGAWPAKDHHFTAGERVVKQIVVMNDTDRKQRFRLTWTVTVNGNIVARRMVRGKLDPAQTKFLPFEFTLPEDLKEKSDGWISLTGSVGTEQKSDVFSFRVFPPFVPAKGKLYVFDPEGRTTRMLKLLGYEVVAWDGQSRVTLVIGREAWSNGHAMPGELEAFVKSGGRVLVFAQSREWLRTALGFRVAAHPSRRVFLVDRAHGAINGIDADDLRDWNGTSTLVAPKTELVDGAAADVWRSDRYGWRWGNRGVVTSAAIEKPHMSAWRPILECEFDLAYSPLMEMEHSRGRIILCTLDLEDHVERDPAAARLAKGIIEYARVSALSPKPDEIVYGGDEAGAQLLSRLGVKYRRSAGGQVRSILVVIGGEAELNSGALEPFMENGGRVLFLPRTGKGAYPRMKLKRVTTFGGSREVPEWIMCRGLSTSDLRWRAPARAWLVKDGVEVGAGGLLGRRKKGPGVAIYCQIDPDRIPADRKTYLRYTRWRQTRALSQILSNMGASFKQDSAIFHFQTVEALKVSLAGEWRGVMTKRLTPADKVGGPPPDPGITPAAKKLVRQAADESGMEVVQVPGLWEEYGGTWEDADGEAVFRKTVVIPEKWAGKDLVLSLGSLDDFDETFFNGVRVGKTDAKVKSFWSHPRKYRVRARHVKAGKNVIAVRIFDHHGGGGFGARPADMFLKLRTAKKRGPTLYHSDYREDFDLGDDPYRYYRW